MQTTTTSPPIAVPIPDTSLSAFYKDMNPPERRTFWACFYGWAMDGMDFMIYPLVIGTIIAMWQVERGQAGLASWAGGKGRHEGSVLRGICTKRCFFAHPHRT